MRKTIIIVGAIVLILVISRLSFRTLNSYAPAPLPAAVVRRGIGRLLLSQKDSGQWSRTTFCDAGHIPMEITR
jgi:hypothetical protein